MAFEGLSGRVNFTGNVDPGPVAIMQVEGNHTVIVGTTPGNYTHNESNLTLDINGGVANTSWLPAPEDTVTDDADDPLIETATIILILQVSGIAVPILAAFICDRVKARKKRLAGGDAAKGQGIM